MKQVETLKNPTLLFIFGTRPEAIKFAPLIASFKASGSFTVEVCVTAQHREMLDQVTEFFGIIPDYDLDIMKPDQNLFDITANSLTGLQKVLEHSKPSCIFVQGDTTSSFTGALAAHYKKIPVAHIEAGLRSGNKFSPFPEEMNRVLAGHLADYHFTPTKRATENLAKENITGNVFEVGNTVIDALLLGLSLISDEDENKIKSSFADINLNARIVLITGHRRESFGEPFKNICEAIKETASEYPDVEFIYPVHMNPNVQAPVTNMLSGIKNIHLIKPLSYPDFIWLLKKSYIVLTDSGGLQEEAPSLGKPVLVMREFTERMEGVDAGTAHLVGSDKNKIVAELKELLDNENSYSEMARSVNPYGDGHACERIVEIIKNKIINKYPEEN